MVTGSVTGIQHWLNLTHVLFQDILISTNVFISGFISEVLWQIQKWAAYIYIFFVCSSFVKIWILYAAIIMQNLLICSYLKLFCSTGRDIEIIAAEILFYWRIVLLQHSGIFVMQLLESQRYICHTIVGITKTCFVLVYLQPFVLQHFCRSEIIWILFAAIVLILLLLLYEFYFCCYLWILLLQVYGFYWCHIYW